MIKLLGIRWSVHPLLVLILLMSAATGYFVELAVLFLTVFIHELGHVLAARGYGWRIRSVKLLPFGGVAETEEAGNLPASEEAVVALAGPLQHVWMGAAAWLLGAFGLCSPSWAAYLLQVNITVGLFNLLPVLPLDGGRLLQALAGRKLPYYRTLALGCGLSLWLSAVMVLCAFYPLAGPQDGLLNLNLLAIGLFLLFSNRAYRRNLPYVFLRFLLHRRAMSADRFLKGGRADPLVVAGSSTVSAVTRLFCRERYHLIYIMEERGMVADVLPEQRIIDAYVDEGKPGRAVSELLG